MSLHSSYQHQRGNNETHFLDSTELRKAEPLAGYSRIIKKRVKYFFSHLFRQTSAHWSVARALSDGDDGKVGYCTMCWSGPEIIVTELSPSDMMLKVLYKSGWIQDNSYHLFSYNSVPWSLRESLNIFLIYCPLTKVRFFPPCGLRMRWYREMKGFGWSIC